MLLPGLDRDEVTFRRRTGADADGNPIGVSTIVFDGRGTYGTPSNKDLSVASSFGQQLDAVIAIRLPSLTTVQPGDKCYLRGQSFNVLWVADLRIHYRVGLQVDL